MKGTITACLLHADFHAMTPECWTTTLLWMGEHEDMPEVEQRSAYQAEVEKAMLEDVQRGENP